MLYTNIWLEIDVDLAKGKTLEVIHVKQFEHDVKKIRVNLFYNGEEVIVPTTGNAARVSASVGGTVTAYQENAYLPNRDDENYVYFPLHESLTTLSGTEHCEVEIYNTTTEKCIYTATFDIIVEPSVASADSPRAVGTTELAGTLSSLDERLTIIEEKGIQSDTLTSIWAGTQSQYGALGTYSDSTLYIISG